MPWVRLHGVKDYYGMALHLLEFPEMRCTINLVPSLLVQLQAYTERGASDRFLDVSRIPADGLSEADCLFLLDHFFMANAGADDPAVPALCRAVPAPRRRPQHRRAKRCAASSERDLRDLQVWFNLTWVHPLAFEQDDGLREPARQGPPLHRSRKELRCWTSTWRSCAQIIPLHRKLAESGQVELTTTPFYPPDPAAAVRQEAGPRGDARRQAAALHRRLSRRRGRPRPPGRRAAHTAVRPAAAGMWPAEGSVCQAMLPLLAQHGIRWIATDEEILSASTQGFVSRDGTGHVRNPDRMYRPYKVARRRRTSWASSSATTP